ncbi:MAG: transposase [Chloroflexi bacterium]|nr:transposase [Chloroflexota bacterium]
MGLPHFQVAGDIYFITNVVYNRLPILTRPSFIVPLIDSWNFYRYKQSYKLLGYVIMPDHFHVLIWPYGDAPVADMMRDFKRFTSGRIARQAEVEGKKEWLEAFRAAGEKTERAEYKVWQDDYWDKNIFSEKMLRQKLNYIHNNPVRAGLVNSPDEYPYSSYRSYELGDEAWIEIDKDWG